MTYFKANWAYNFSCNRSLEEICEIFNATGPWKWEMRDSYIFGYYLNTRPADGLHFRVHAFPQAFIGQADDEESFSALLQIKSETAFEKVEMDGIFRKLIDRIMAIDIKEVEPYD